MGVGSQLRAGCWRIEKAVSRIWAPTPIGGLTLTEFWVPASIPGRDCARRRSNLSFAWPKESHHRGGHPHCQRPAAIASWNLRCSPHGGMPQTRGAQTCVLLIPVVLRSSALCRGGPRGAGPARRRRASRLGRERGLDDRGCPPPGQNELRPEGGIPLRERLGDGFDSNFTAHPPAAVASMTKPNSQAALVRQHRTPLGSGADGGTRCSRPRK